MDSPELFYRLLDLLCAEGAVLLILLFEGAYTAIRGQVT